MSFQFHDSCVKVIKSNLTSAFVQRVLYKIMKQDPYAQILWTDVATNSGQIIREVSHA